MLSEKRIKMRIVDALCEKGVSILEISRRTGLSRNTISLYVNRDTTITVSNLLKIINAIGVKPQDIFYDEVE